MSDLPAVRLAIYKPVFCYTRVYYIGPIILKQSKKTRANSGQSKCYGVVLTRLTTKLSVDLSTHSFILVLQRFTARRCQPKTIWSDNGTNVSGVNKELKRA